MAEVRKLLVESGVVTNIIVCDDADPDYAALPVDPGGVHLDAVDNGDGTYTNDAKYMPETEDAKAARMKAVAEGNTEIRATLAVVAEAFEVLSVMSSAAAHKHVWDRYEHHLKNKT